MIANWSPFKFDFSIENFDYFSKNKQADLRNVFKLSLINVKE